MFQILLQPYAPLFFKGMFEFFVSSGAVRVSGPFKSWSWGQRASSRWNKNHGGYNFFLILVSKKKTHFFIFFSLVLWSFLGRSRMEFFFFRIPNIKYYYYLGLASVFGGSLGGSFMMTTRSLAPSVTTTHLMIGVSHF